MKYCGSLQVAISNINQALLELKIVIIRLANDPVLSKVNIKYAQAP